MELGENMKKIVLLLCASVLTINFAYSRDYAKLQLKEIKHAQKYQTTQKYFENAAHTKLNNNPNTTNINIKDPKLIKLGNYEIIEDNLYNDKLMQDKTKYDKIAKSFNVRTVDNYNAQAKGEDYYKIYRVAEKIIRANKLDYINWRIGVYRDADNPNAYSTNMNYIAISTSMYDTFSKNDDALAMLIGHEIGHAILGHQQRCHKTLVTMNRLYKKAMLGNEVAALTYKTMERKYLIDSKNMEYAADIEGAKLAAKAGFNLDEGSELLSFLNTLPSVRDYYSDHPDSEKRIENFNENRKYFLEDEWAKIGRYNIYHSDVLDVNLSSDRKSIVINAPTEKLSPNEYYHPETPQDLYLRFGYKYYLNGEFDKSLKYFNDLFKVDNSNAIAYLYASYAAQALHKSKGNAKSFELAREYINNAHKLEPDNIYIKEQLESLK